MTWRSIKYSLVDWFNTYFFLALIGALVGAISRDWVNTIRFYLITILVLTCWDVNKYKRMRQQYMDRICYALKYDQRMTYQGLWLDAQHAHYSPVDWIFKEAFDRLLKIGGICPVEKMWRGTLEYTLVEDDVSYWSISH